MRSSGSKNIFVVHKFWNLKYSGVEMKRVFKDFYGCTASISESSNGFRLRVSNGCGQRIKNQLYTSYRGARSAMSRMSDCWKEVAE